MAIIKLKKNKNAQHFELNAVQDVKVNGISVFDGEEANINLKTINNQDITGIGNIDIGIAYEFEAEYELRTIYIPAENLNYIRQELPKHIIVHLLSDGDETDVIIFTLADADDIKISYLNILQSSSRTLRYSFLTINATDTEITGSEISTSNYILIPTPPQNNKTYILKSTGGIINWVEET